MKEEKTNKVFVDPRYAKGKTYKKVVEEIQTEEVCPFCPKTFKWHTKPILKNNCGWFITENFNPYKNAKYHFLIIGKKHKETLSDLTLKDWKSILLLIKWALKKFDIDGGGITMRFGNTIKTGATVKHFHCHLITPVVKKGKTMPVYFPIG